MATWKAVERAICKRLGLQRVGPAGDGTTDGINDWLSVEIKHRKSLPAWLTRALSQAQHDTNDGQRLALVVLHEKYKNHDDDLVLLRLSDFIRWFCEEINADGGS